MYPQNSLNVIFLLVHRSWPNVQRWLRAQPYFSDYFLEPTPGLPWHQTDVIDTTDAGADERIPFDALDSVEADSVYRAHVTRLRDECRRNE